MKLHKTPKHGQDDFSKTMNELTDILLGRSGGKRLEASPRAITVNPDRLAMLTSEFNVKRPVHIQFVTRIPAERVAGSPSGPDGPEGRSGSLMAFRPSEMLPVDDPQPIDHIIQITTDNWNRKPKPLKQIEETIAHEMMHCAQNERYNSFEEFSKAFDRSSKHLNELSAKGLDLFGFKFSPHSPVPAGYEINPFEAEARFAQTIVLSVELSMLVEEKVDNG